MPRRSRSPPELRSCSQARGDAEHHYNEAIVDIGPLQRALPASLEAVFYLTRAFPGAKSPPSEGALRHHEAHAREVHKNFLKHYALDPKTFPLLKLDLVDGGDAPFSDAPAEQVWD